MKKKHRLLLVIAALFCVLALTGCGSLPSAQTDPTDTPQTFDPDFSWDVKIYSIDYDAVQNQPDILQMSYESCQKYKKASYTEAFFADHTLLLIPTTGGGATAFAVTGVQYADGVLTCLFTSYKPDEPVASTADIYGLTVFVELDTVLPEGTKLQTQWTETTVDAEIYIQKRSELAKAFTPDS